MTHRKNIESTNKEAYVSTSTYHALEDLKNKRKLGERENMQKSSSSSLEVQVSVSGCNVTVRGTLDCSGCFESSGREKKYEQRVTFI